MPHERPLEDLLAALQRPEVRGDTRVHVAGVAYRSADVGPGWLFFAVPGRTADGHSFAAEAARRGAAVIVVERWLDDPPDAVTQVRVVSVREAMGPVAAAFYGRPADRLAMVGVTGTNGKTTTTYLLERIFEAAGMRAGVIGTTGVRIDRRAVPHDRTTPEAPDLH
ncbi:MAG TPA: Mur ligase family protein, partial [Actinomycetota bacterium]|nr:Mur ligase family protein [Actinomycetota bacterium]